MAAERKRCTFVSTAWTILFVVALTIGAAISSVAKVSTTDGDDIEKRLTRLNKPSVKTITTTYGDIIDCLEIRKQAAFDNPLLKDQKIYMKPTFFPKGDRGSSSGGKRLFKPTWMGNASCPDGTVSVKRVTKEDLLAQETLSVLFQSTGYPMKSKAINQVESPARVEKAGMSTTDGVKTFGGKFTTSIATPNVEAYEFSFSSMIISNWNNFIAVGWGVFPMRLPDYASRLIGLWMVMTGSKVHLCFNYGCPGFVQISKTIHLGDKLSDTFKGNLADVEEMEATVYLDPVQNVWWMVYGDDEAVGYWPQTLFKGFDSVLYMFFGGRVYNTQGCLCHTFTQMGTGRHGLDVAAFAAYFSNVRFVNSSFMLQYPPSGSLTTKQDYPGCYSAGLQLADPKGPMVHYGGPGGWGCCMDGTCRATAAGADPQDDDTCKSRPPVL